MQDRVEWNQEKGMYKFNIIYDQNRLDSLKSDNSKGAFKRTQTIHNKMKNNHEIRKKFNEALQAGFSANTFQLAEERKDLDHLPRLFCPLNYVYQEKSSAKDSGAANVRPTFDCSYIGENPYNYNQIHSSGPCLDNLAKSLYYIRCHEFFAISDLKRSYWSVLIDGLSSSLNRL